MKNFVFIILFMFFAMPVFAGQYEDALRSGQPVFLYLHSKDCKYCKTFNPIFEKISQSYKNDYHFVSIDAYSPYGALLMQDFRAMYVPYVVLADSRRRYLMSIEPGCLTDNACLDKELKNFLK